MLNYQRVCPFSSAISQPYLMTPENSYRGRKPQPRPWLRCQASYTGDYAKLQESVDVMLEHVVFTAKSAGKTWKKQTSMNSPIQWSNQDFTIVWHANCLHTSTFLWSKNPEGDACDGRREDPVQWRFEWLCEQRSSAQNLDSAAGDEIFLWLWTQHVESPSGFLYDFEHLCKATMSKFTESHGLQVIESPGFPSLSHSWSSCLRPWNAMDQ